MIGGVQSVFSTPLTTPTWPNTTGLLGTIGGGKKGSIDSGTSAAGLFLSPQIGGPNGPSRKSSHASLQSSNTALENESGEVASRPHQSQFESGQNKRKADSKPENGTDHTDKNASDKAQQQQIAGKQAKKRKQSDDQKGRNPWDELMTITRY